MGSREDLVLVDTNVFVIDLCYKRDKTFAENQRFLEFIAHRGTGFTTTYNLLELCGILSFNLNQRQLVELWHYFPHRYKVGVLPTHDLSHEMPGVTLEDLFGRISKRCPLGDSIFLALAERHLGFVKTMATWDKEHFLGKFPGAVMTPGEFLATV